MKYKIYAGLGGGFGGANFIDTFEGEYNDAEDFAFEEACQIFDSQLGAGIESEEDIMASAGEAVDEEDYDDPEELEAVILEVYDEIYNDLREQWIEYRVVEYDDEEEDDEDEDSK